MKKHQLKIWPESYRAVISMKKKFEVRKDDREFEIGDTLLLREFVPEFECDGELVVDENGRSKGYFTGRAYMTKIICKYVGAGVSLDYCILGIS